METICMKSHSLFSGKKKNKKNSDLLSAEFAKRLTSPRIVNLSTDSEIFDHLPQNLTDPTKSHRSTDTEIPDHLPQNLTM